MIDNVIPFPPRLRMVSASGDPPSPELVETVLVDHGGRAYPLAALLACLSLAKLAEVEATLPRTGQATWDEVVRRWPALAEEIVAGCRAQPVITRR